MTTAHFQPLTWLCWWRLTGWMVGILRVYAPGDSYAASSKYKFITVGVIRHHVVTIHGMRSSGIRWRDVKALDKVLFRLGIKQAVWTHDGVTQNYTLRG